MKLNEYVNRSNELVNRLFSDANQFGRMPYPELMVELEKTIQALGASCKALNTNLDIASQRLQENQGKDLKGQALDEANARVKKNTLAKEMLSNCQNVLVERLRVAQLAIGACEPVSQRMALKSGIAGDFTEIQSDILWINYLHHRVLASIKRQDVHRHFQTHVNKFMESETKFINDIQRASRSASDVLKSSRSTLVNLYGLEKLNRIEQLVILLGQIRNHFTMTPQEMAEYRKVPQSAVLFLMKKFFSGEWQSQLKHILFLGSGTNELVQFFKDIHAENELWLSEDRLSSIEQAFYAVINRLFYYQKLIERLKADIESYRDYEHPLYQPVEQGRLVSSDRLDGMLANIINCLKKARFTYTKTGELSLYKEEVKNELNALASTHRLVRFAIGNARNDEQTRQELMALQQRLPTCHEEHMSFRAAEQHSGEEIADEHWEYGVVVVVKEIVEIMKIRKNISAKGLDFFKRLCGQAKVSIQAKAKDEFYETNYLAFSKFFADNYLPFAQLGISGVGSMFLIPPSVGLVAKNDAVMESKSGSSLVKPTVPVTTMLSGAIVSSHSEELPSIVSFVESSVDESLENIADVPYVLDISEIKQRDPEEVYSLANKYEKAMKFEEAEVCYALAAEDGHRDAQYQLARLYERGLSRERESNKLVLGLYMNALRQKRGSKEAYYAVGRLYEEGIVVNRDYQVAANYYMKSKETGVVSQYYPPAAYALGRLYEEGHLELPNQADDRVKVAQQWYRKAIDNIDLNSGQKSLYEKSLEVNRARADAYYRLGRLQEAEGREDLARASYTGAVHALPSGHASAQVRLGMLHERGGIEKGAPKYVSALSSYQQALSVESYEFSLYSSLNHKDMTLPTQGKQKVYIDPVRRVWMVCYEEGDVFRGVLPEWVNLEAIRERMNTTDFKEWILCVLVRESRHIRWGDPEAYIRLGNLYFYDRAGIQRDSQRAYDCFLKAGLLANAPLNGLQLSMPLAHRQEEALEVLEEGQPVNENDFKEDGATISDKGIVQEGHVSRVSCSSSLSLPALQEAAAVVLEKGTSVQNQDQSRKPPILPPRHYASEKAREKDKAEESLSLEASPTCSITSISSGNVSNRGKVGRHSAQVQLAERLKYLGAVNQDPDLDVDDDWSEEEDNTAVETVGRVLPAVPSSPVKVSEASLHERANLKQGDTLAQTSSGLVQSSSSFWKKTEEMAVVQKGDVGLRAKEAEALFKEGCDFGRTKEFEKVIEKFKAASDLGHAMAKTRLGQFHMVGSYGVSLDKMLAHRFFTEAAELGESGAMTYLARQYKNGDGVEKNVEKAKYWYRQALEKVSDDKLRAELQELEKQVKYPAL